MFLNPNAINQMDCATGHVPPPLRNQCFAMMAIQTRAQTHALAGHAWETTAPVSLQKMFVEKSMIRAVGSRHGMRHMSAAVVETVEADFASAGKR